MIYKKRLGVIWVLLNCKFNKTCIQNIQQLNTCKFTGSLSIHWWSVILEKTQLLNSQEPPSQIASAQTHE